MPAGTYTQQNLRDFLNGRIRSRLDQLRSPQDLLNQAVREVLGEIDLRGSKRKSVLASNVFDDVYTYTLPSDVKGIKIIDIIPQKQFSRERWDEWMLVTEEEFDRKKRTKDNLVALGDDELARVLFISKVVDDESIDIAQFESLTGDGDTWSTFATSITDSGIKQDAVDFIQGAASLRFSGNGDTDDTALGIQNKGIAAFDISQYLSGGSALAWARLTNADSNIKQVSIRLGSDSGNYYQISDTATQEGTAFVTGWNLLGFNLVDRTIVGTPVDTTIDYVALFWSKNVNTHISDTDDAFDNLIINKGAIYSLLYYSKFLWQTTATVAYKENSTATTDTLSLDMEELELILLKSLILAAWELRDYDDVKIAKQFYDEKRKEYQMSYPSESMILMSQPYEFGTMDGEMKKFDS
mgnify:CR=1 FL=1